jgi:hypothetical protein
MTNLIVKLENHGFFEVPSVGGSSGSLRVGFNPEYSDAPWVVLSKDAEGIRWELLFSYSDLDRALAYAVRLQVGADQPWDYKIVLPCGQEFQRPGRVPAERVLASMGWLYVTHLIGYAIVPIAHAESVKQAQDYLTGIVVDTNIKVGGIDPVEGAAAGWCANLVIEYHGFIHRDQLELELRTWFHAEGVEILPEIYDFRCRQNVPASAEIISFEDKRKARLLAA